MNQLLRALLAGALLTGCSASRQMGLSGAQTADPQVPDPQAVNVSLTVPRRVAPYGDTVRYRLGRDYAFQRYRPRGAGGAAFLGALLTGPMVPMVLFGSAPRLRGAADTRAPGQSRRRQRGGLPYYDQGRRAMVELDTALYRSPDFIAGYRLQAMRQRNAVMVGPVVVGSVGFALGVTALVLFASLFTGNMRLM